MTSKQKIDKALCEMINGSFSLVDALDPAFRAMAMKAGYHLVCWIQKMAKCCEPEPCPPTCEPCLPPPPPPPPTEVKK